MKIKYLHVANDGVEKIHDTEISFRNSGRIGLIEPSDMDQAKWDEFTLKCFERDLKKGIVLSYSVLEEGA